MWIGIHLDYYLRKSLLSKYCWVRSWSALVKAFFNGGIEIVMFFLLLFVVLCLCHTVSETIKIATQMFFVFFLFTIHSVLELDTSNMLFLIWSRNFKKFFLEINPDKFEKGYKNLAWKIVNMTKKGEGPWFPRWGFLSKFFS